MENQNEHWADSITFNYRLGNLRVFITYHNRLASYNENGQSITQNNVVQWRIECPHDYFVEGSANSILEAREIANDFLVTYRETGSEE